MFWIGVLFSFVVYPDDLEGASNAITILSGTGCLVALFFIVQNIKNLWNNRKQ